MSPETLYNFSEKKITENKVTEATKEYALQALSMMDLTSLNEDDTEQAIKELCAKQQNNFGHTAAVCIYPQFIKTAKQALADNEATDVKVATVTNFPHGNDDIAVAVKETIEAVEAGADEVDVVFPYRALIAGNEQVGAELVKACKEACQSAGATLKVIIESGELKTAELIKQASEIAIANGADFIKTSTGKVAVNATLETAEIMLNAIKASGKQVGFKAAGGVRSSEDAKAYIQLAEQIMGADWITVDTFRFGASGLLGSLLATLNDEAPAENTASY
ncbi:deoxyribose-phosphate aldolase [Psychrobacter sp. HD31]|uniref:deoxyribose-phosphate aldolase n=1 Tax=Psychrobacter sp. HD31 TaxID=3112003 RepID=UPI003DA4AEE7